jgi:outer membrane protein assembly factor BamB
MQENEINDSPEKAATKEQPKSLRLLPGLVLGVVLALVAYALPLIAPNAEVFGLPLSFLGIMGGILCGLAILVWWLFFSRASWGERIGAIVVMIVALLITRLIVHKSIAEAGMGLLLYFSALPGLCLALVVGAVVSQRFSANMRRGAVVALILLACVPWLILRTEGVSNTVSQYRWRWTPTPEERLLAQANDEPKPLPSETPTPAASASVSPTASPSASPSTSPSASVAASVAPSAPAAAEKPAEWPGFRGQNRDSIVRGVKIKTDWAASPPVQIWRKPIGPGWSSFAVRGDLLYTQEQRGEEELVACYKVSSGEPVWRHKDAVRFWESNAGAGPRATPTLHGNRVYAFGATGILNALDANTGKVVWTRNVATEVNRKVPTWGFASSPLVLDDLVIVAAEGTLAAYELATGKPRWQGPSYGGSYSSPHRAMMDGVQQVVLLGGPGAISVAPGDGKVLWEHKWQPGAITQPALTAEGDIIVNTLATTGGIGTRRLHVTQSGGKWTAEEKWTSNGLKPYFNDFVVHKGFAYGFDGNILSSIDLADGKRKWKGGRYGNGQLVLLPEQDLLLVISEEGELALVSATTDQFKEIGRFKVLEGKTWNHPVLVGDTLLVRNGEEMAAFRLTRAGI